MRLLAQHELSGYGNGGEGMALQQLPDGRRVLYIAHLEAPKDFSVVEVTDPRKPKLLLQTELPHDKVRSNSLALVDDLLMVAYQASEPGLTPAGMSLFDVSVPESPKLISHFDTSGPSSRGAHTVWCVDGRYAHLSTGASDFAPTHPYDDQFYMIVDIGDPTKPIEVGRWWLPGTSQGDNVRPPERHREFDSGHRLHNANVYPQRPDRAYLGYIDSGVVILDISNLASPQLVSQVDYHPPLPGFTHTVVPLFDRGLLVVTDEAIYDDCQDWPKLVWLMDMREETNPVIVSTLPMPSKEEFCGRPGRFGAHNVHENQPVPTSWVSERYVVGAFFNAGVRVYDIEDPFRPEEVACYIPPAPDGDLGININDVYVDEKGLVYAVDRFVGGLYILEMDI